MTELSKHYDAAEVEARWYGYWLERKLFHGDPARGGEPYCIVIPPPNVTGILHMGHALNNTLQDVLIRWKKMQGYNACWVPGTDHAGIATQNVVERALQRKGASRDELGRDAFLREVWAWKEQYGETIINQLKKIGAACDWDRERFTMDEGLNRAVLEVFVRLYDKGLIYRGNYIINWCPRCRTALSDEESEHEQHDGKLYYIRYPAAGSADGESVVVATTRPETMLGDVAVAVNPQDDRYASLVGRRLVLPILGRELEVVADDFVDPAFGTGAVKVTPAHDPNDFEMGLRHGLRPLNVMNEDGTMNEAAGPYAGRTREDCRAQLVDDLRRDGMLVEIRDHSHAVGHCYRCHTVVEPRLSPQWFVRMKPLAEPAIAAVRDGRIRFIPDRWTKVYLEWMENIRDWCISRQIWWGHRIPVFHCGRCDHEWASLEPPAVCLRCGDADVSQDPDVLDTWFSSWLWPFSVFGWPEQTESLGFFYPTQTLATASEIIFFWVARMIMAGCEFMGDIPFSEVYIHGTVRAEDGRKMSKSLGNSIDPLDIVEKYSADALRFSLIMLTATGQDVYVSDEKFEVGRNFGTKMWNAARYVKMQTRAPLEAPHRPDFAGRVLSADDQHLLRKLHRTIAECNEHLERFRFNDMAKSLYEFLWHQYCDWYVEYSKDVLYGPDGSERETVLRLMHYTLGSALRLLHPVMPFLTEELWHGMGYHGESESILEAPWPEAADEARLAVWGVSEDAERYVDAKHELIRRARTLRADYSIPPTQPVDFVFRPRRTEDGDRLREDRRSLVSLLKAGEVKIDPDFQPDGTMPSTISELGAVYLSLDGVIDVDAEVARLQGQLEKLDADLARIESKLSNEQFVRKAPSNVVEQQRTRRHALREKQEKLQQMISTLAK